MKKIYHAKRNFEFAPSSFNEESMTVECIYATETPVDRGEFMEVLDISPEALDACRLDSKAVALIWNHEWDDPRVVGRVVRHWIEGRNAIALIQLSTSQYSKGTVDDIKSGVIKSVSVGYDVLDYEDEKSKSAGQKVIRRVKRWMPFEVSIVGIPADYNAQFRSRRMEEDENITAAEEQNVEFAEAIEEAETKIADAMDALLIVIDAADEETAAERARNKAWKIQSISSRALQASATEEEVAAAVEYALEELEKVSEILEEADADEDEETTPPSEEVAAERSRVASISAMCRSYRVSEADTQRMIRTGVSVKGARDMIKNTKVRSSARGLITPRTTIIRDRGETRKKGLTAALYSRLSGKPVEDIGREYRGMSFREIAKDIVGASARGMKDKDLFSAMTRSFGPQTSSDVGFNGALGNAMNLRLRDAYDLGPREWEPIVRRTTVRNFLPQTVIGAGSFPALRHIPEGAEIEFGTAIGESGTFQVLKYGRGTAFTFEAFINDDIRFIDAMLTNTGRTARGFEDKMVFNALTSDALLSDGLPTFSTQRGNLISEALDLQGLAVAQAALRRQTDVDGEPLSLRGSVLIVGPDLELAAWRLATPIVAADSTQVNPFSGVIKNVIVDARIEGDDWYLTAGQDADVIELAYLDGHEGVQVEEEYNPTISATAYYAKAYAGSALTGWRGLVKSVGGNEIEG